MADAPADVATARPADDADDEMPLLFSDGLPADFARNAQLAALLTLMPSDQEEEEEEDDDGSLHAVRRRRATRRKTREPYARIGSDVKQKTSADAGGKKATRREGTAKELSLYLSMFKVSND